VFQSRVTDAGNSLFRAPSSNFTGVECPITCRPAKSFLHWGMPIGDAASDVFAQQYYASLFSIHTKPLRDRLTATASLFVHATNAWSYLKPTRAVSVPFISRPSLGLTPPVVYYGGENMIHITTLGRTVFDRLFSI
jgi:hypothetical protein